MTILIALYAHPEAYPPTLNAIMECARQVDKVVVVCRRTLPTNWEFPDNVELVFTTPLIDVADLDGVSAARKAVHFARFVAAIRRTIRSEPVGLAIAYDAIPLLACAMAKAEARGEFLLWYHNHDARSPADHTLFSVGWVAELLESRLFSLLDVFSLPAAERLEFFPVEKVRDRLYHIPNYPPKHLYDGDPIDETDEIDQIKEGDKADQVDEIEADEEELGAEGRCRRRTSDRQGFEGTPHDEIRMIYQGSIGPHHGFEEIFPYLKRTVAGRNLRLTLMGKAWPRYREHLEELVGRYGIEDRVDFIDFRPYAEVRDVLAAHDVGLAIHKPVGITYSTGGTASNKIYEYAAAGLPVVLLDNEHYRRYLGGHDWTVFTDLGWDSFRSCLTQVLGEGGAMRAAARADFRGTLNFEKVFCPVLKEVISWRSHGRRGAAAGRGPGTGCRPSTVRRGPRGWKRCAKRSGMITLLSMVRGRWIRDRNGGSRRWAPDIGKTV
jgi:glycosyltransferase involved in cell wall biosynthesis